MRISSKIALSGTFALTALAGLAWSGVIGPDTPQVLASLVTSDAPSQGAFGDAPGRQAPTAPVGYDWRQLLH